MNEDGSHPNWAALATTTFQFKKFVRATEPDNPVGVSSREPNRDDANGEATKHFYDQILSDENLARRKPKLENAKVETKNEIMEHLSDTYSNLKKELLEEVHSKILDATKIKISENKKNNK